MPAFRLPESIPSRKSPASDRVLAALASWADLAGECSPTIAQVMAETGLSERWVRETLGDLELSGQLQRSFIAGQRTVYQLQVRNSAPRQSAPGQSAPGHCSETLEIAHVRGGGIPKKTQKSRGGGYILQRSFLLPIERKEGSSERKPREAEPAGFATWWAAYPRKVGKFDAVRAYGRALKRGATPEALMAGLLRYPFSDDPQFRPHPATWLNQGRWMDEPDSEPNVVAFRRSTDRLNGGPALLAELRRRGELDPNDDDEPIPASRRIDYGD